MEPRSPMNRMMTCLRAKGSRAASVPVEHGVVQMAPWLVTKPCSSGMGIPGGSGNVAQRGGAIACAAAPPTPIGRFQLPRSVGASAICQAGTIRSRPAPDRRSSTSPSARPPRESADSGSSWCWCRSKQRAAVVRRNCDLKVSRIQVGQAVQVDGAGSLGVLATVPPAGLVDPVVVVVLMLGCNCIVMLVGGLMPRVLSRLSRLTCITATSTSTSGFARSRSSTSFCASAI